MPDTTASLLSVLIPALVGAGLMAYLFQPSKRKEAPSNRNTALIATIAGGVAGARGREPAVAPLSEREQEVLRLLGQGHTNQAVAEQLDLSPKTVATYRARIADKLGLKTTADFVRYASNTGLLAPPGPAS